MIRAARFIILVSVVLASLVARDARACGCPPPCYVDLATGQCLPVRPPPPTVNCALSASATHVERVPGQPVRVRVDYTISNFNYPPATDFAYSLTASAERYDGAQAASTVAYTRTGQFSTSCGAGGVGTCTVTAAPAPTGVVVLDPIGLTLPANPSVFRGSTTFTIDCGDCANSSLATFTLTVATAPVGGCSSSTCIELLPCGSFGDSGVPVIDTEAPILCADSAESVPVTFRVIRNQFPASRLPLIATVVPANDIDPTDLFGVFPASFQLDFDGGTGTEQSFTVGCETHGPCFAGVANSLSVTLADKDGVPVASPTSRELVHVVVCETPYVRKNFEGQDGDEFHYAIVARNPSLADPVNDVVITDSFPGQRILSVQGAIGEFMFDDALGFVTPLSARLVPATVAISGEDLTISGFSLVTRDMRNIRVIPDTVTFEIVTQTKSALPCGPLPLNSGPTLVGAYVLPTGRMPISGTAPGLTATCVCPHTLGFWKTHHSGAKNPSQQDPWPTSERATLCGKTWLEWLNASPRGDAFVILAHQWIAAMLNVAEGAATNAEVDAALQTGEALLSACSISAADRATATQTSELLDAFNNDRFGLRACAP